MLSKYKLSKFIKKSIELKLSSSFDRNSKEPYTSLFSESDLLKRIIKINGDFRSTKRSCIEILVSWPFDANFCSCSCLKFRQLVDLLLWLDWFWILDKQGHCSLSERFLSCFLSYGVNNNFCPETRPCLVSIYSHPAMTKP